jgi:hypothetical protein
MFFMSKADVLYEAYKKAQRIELALDGERMPKVWHSQADETTSKEWRERFTNEILRTYSEYKEYGMELQRRVIDLEEEVRKLKLENLALLESKEKHGN